MKKQLILNKSAFAKALFFCFLALACVSGFAESAQSENVMQVYTLKNGIPVYFKANTENQIDSIGIAVSGGVVQLPPEKSGLEQVLFSLMTTSSSKYSFEKRQALSFDNKSSIWCSTLECGSILALNCIDYYFDEMLPVLIDGFMKPKFAQKEYDKLMTNVNQQLQYMQNDPTALLFYTGQKMITKDHPYETNVSPTPESVSSITLANMKDLHKNILDARRISVVVVGHTDAQALVKKLNSTLGTIPSLKTTLASTEVPPLTVSGDPVIIPHESAAGTGFIARAFAAPSCTSADYVPSIIAAQMFSETMFNIVRVKYGACYSPNSFVEGAAASYGAEFLYRVSNLQHFASFVKEARSIMAQGKLIKSVLPNGTYEYESIENRLESFQNSSINSIYASTATTGGIMNRMITSLLQYGDISALDNRPAQLRAVTAADVERVFKTYWLSGSGRWFVVTGPEDVQTVQFTE